MKSFLKFCLLIICIIPCTTNSFAQEWYELTSQEPVNIEAVKQSAEKYFDKIGRGKHTGYKQYQRWLNNAMHKTDINGVPYTQNHVSKQMEKFRANTSNRKQKIATLNASSDADNNWKPLGPFYEQGNRIGKNLGQIITIAVEPKDQKLLFVGSQGGGLWRSTDAGISWEPLTDDSDNMIISAVAVDPHNANRAVYMNDSSEIFESLDQGKTWNQIADLNDPIRFGKRMIAFDPINPGVFFVLARAIYKTTDGGKTFKNVLDVQMHDIYVKPEDPSIVYSCANDFWRSTDAGETWKKVTNGIDISDRMKMTVTPADPDRVYILQQNGNGVGFGRIYKSTDSGASFDVMSDIEKGAPDYLESQSWRAMGIMASATDPDKLHMGGVKHFRSDDGGVTLYHVPNSTGTADPRYIHADVITMTNVNGTLYAGTDGGIFRSTDNGENYIALTGGLMTTQFYRMGGTSPFPGTGEGLDPDMLMGGAQDNGTQISKGPDHEWDRFTGSDGMECIIDYTNDQYIYSSKQSGVLLYSDDGGRTFGALNRPEQTGTWTTPFEMDSKTPTTLYSGYSELYMSTDSGMEWEALTNGETDGELLHEIAIAPSDNNYIYISHSRQLWVSTNAQSTNRTWREVTVLEGSVYYISVDPNDPAHTLLACSGSLIYETKDAGITWNEISGNLPDIAMASVLIDNSPENRMYVGTQQGVFYKDDNMINWEVFGNGLPRCSASELEMHYQSNKLRVATYGRGIWEIPVFGTNETETIITPQIIVETTEEKCPGEAIQLTIENDPSWENPISYQWYKNETSIAGATNSIYNATEQANYTVKVTTNTASGTSEGIQVNFLEAPTPPTVTAEQLCGAGTVTLTANGTANGTIKWYSDANTLNEIAEGNTYSVDIDETTTFYVKELSNTTNCYSPTTTATAVVLIPLNAPEVNDQTVCSPGEVIITASSSENGTIRWFNNDNPNEIIETGNTFTTNIENTTSFLVDVNPDSDVNCVSPKALVTVTIDECLGLTTFEKENLVLYPNPTHGLMSLKVPEGFNLISIEITDILGKSLKTYKEYQEQINLENFSSGTYFVKVTSDNGSKIFKIVIP